MLVLTTSQAFFFCQLIFSQAWLFTFGARLKICTDSSASMYPRHYLTWTKTHVNKAAKRCPDATVSFGFVRECIHALVSMHSEHSLPWLNACPTAALGLRLQPSECTVLSKLYLGEPVMPLNQPLNCEACAESMDAYGDHLLCCRKSGFIQRHQTLASQLWHLCTAAGFNATSEVSISGRCRPADILLPHWQAGGPCAIDISVVHPLAPSVPVHTENRPRSRGGYGTSQALQIRPLLHREQCRFSPIRALNIRSAWI